MNPQDLNAFHHDLHSAKLIPSMALIIRQPLPTISQEKRRRASIYFYPHQIALTLLFFKGGKIVV